MIFDRLTFFRVLFPRSASAAVDAATRWREAADRDPGLAEDVVRIGGVLAAAPRRYAGGVEVPEPIDPIRMAKAEGRREMALELLAMMSVSSREFLELMENSDA